MAVRTVDSRPAPSLDVVAQNRLAVEKRVLDLIVEGLTNREISERLEISEKTVKNYVSVILDKLGVRSRTQAAILHERWRRDDPESDAS